MSFRNEIGTIHHVRKTVCIMIFILSVTYISHRTSTALYYPDFYLSAAKMNAISTFEQLVNSVNSHLLGLVTHQKVLCLEKLSSKQNLLRCAAETDCKWPF